MTPSWLRDSVAEGKPLPCDGYVAFSDLYDETVRNCPSCDQRPCVCEDTADDRDVFPSPVHEYPEYPSPPASPSSAPVGRPVLTPSSFTSARVSSPVPSVHIPDNLLPPPSPIPTFTERLSWQARYSCQRASPLICSNQDLALELDVIKRSRALEGEDRSALSYSRAIAAVKGMHHHWRTYMC